ncbi:hypothetical protein EV401DRAFT_1974794 [Pisolithus croceorrhizus]|nr:hypothetical protein EV401DRAFT_1974794 [Pisolithus croceorrhizus]
MGERESMDRARQAGLIIRTHGGVKIEADKLLIPEHFISTIGWSDGLQGAVLISFRTTRCKGDGVAPGKLLGVGFCVGRQRIVSGYFALDPASSPICNIWTACYQSYDCGFYVLRTQVLEYVEESRHAWRCLIVSSHSIGRIQVASYFPLVW